MPIIKSNAYGHGLFETAKIIQTKSDIIGVVSADEALTLRKKNIRKKIIALSYFNPEDVEIAVRQNIILPVYSYTMAQQISRAAKKIKKRAVVHIKIDVGTSRLGVLAENALGFARRINKLPNLKIEGIYSHLADSENFNQRFTNLQIKIFTKTVELLEQDGFKFKYQHLACSAATLINPKSRFNLVRIGISLYGLWPSNETKKLYHNKFNSFSLKPVLSWHTRIIHIKEIPKNSSIGYGCTFVTKKKTTIAILPVGYWDGYDRKNSNRSSVLLRNKRVKIIGRVCMNMVILDVTAINKPRVGELITLIGNQGRETISADELAQNTGTINYEVVTRINPLLPRVITH